MFVVIYGGSTFRVDFRIPRHVESLLDPKDQKYFYECIRALSSEDEPIVLPEYIHFATVENEDYLEALETMMIMALGTILMGKTLPLS
jgi:hypothetical protein